MKRSTYTFFGILIIFLLSLGVDLTAQVVKQEIGNLQLENIPAIPDELAGRLSQYQNTRAASIVDWTPNGEHLLISTRFAETAQFHLVKKPGGAREQLTFFEEPVGGGRYCPAVGEQGFLFTKDIGGNEFFQLYYFSHKDGKHRLVSDGKSRNGMGIWSNLGDRFVYNSTRRNKSDYDIFLHRLDGRFPETTVYEGIGSWSPIAWSPNDRYLTISNFISANESRLYILDVKTGETTPVSESDTPSSYRSGLWTNDGKGLFLTSDHNSEFAILKYYDIENQQFTNITHSIPWDVSGLSLSPNGQWLAFTVNEHGIEKLYLLEVETKKFRPVTTIPVGIISGLRWNKDNKRLAFSLETAVNPADVYVLNTITYGLEQWTFSETGGLAKSTFVAPTLFHFPTFDYAGASPRMIPAFLYQPKEDIGPYPVVIDIHGGPEGQSRPEFNPLYQFLLNEMGIAVITPNVRGSSGYGKSYLKLDNGYQREESVKDIGALLDWIQQQPALDASRVAVRGGSYGGYMVLASMIHFNDRLRCGIDVVGISNFVTFLNNTQAYRRDLRRAEYGDERDPKMREFLEGISPTYHAHKITKPLFIAQGLNDPRVPASESKQMLDVIRNNGGKAWYMLAKDEGHGFRKKNNRDFFAAASVLFLEKFLLNAESN